MSDAELAANEPPTLHDAIESAIDEHEDPTGEQEAEAPAGAEVTVQGEGRTRDAQGRFAAAGGEAAAEAGAVQPEAGGDPAPAATPVVDGEGALPGDGGEPAPDPGEVKAPQSWTPTAREHWGNLPPEVRAEVGKREREMNEAFNRTTQERQLAGAFHQVVAPYQAMIQGEGSDPIRATQELFKTAYLMRSGTPAQKAQGVAGIIQQFGVDIQALDAILSSGITQPHNQHMQQPQQQQPPQQPMHDPRFDQLLTAWQAQRDEQANAEVGAFGSLPEHEFFEDVRDQMADLIEMSERKNVDLSLVDAYTQACKLHPEISKVVDQRARAKAAAEGAGGIRRSRRAASSVSGSPAGAPPPSEGPQSRREAIEEALDNAEG